MPVCTTEDAFSHVTGEYLFQVDGVSMGSPANCKLSYR